MSNYKVKLENIKAFAFDVDGVLTDGSIICLPETGDWVRTFNSKDGLGMRMAYMSGFRLGIITGGASESIRKRFEHVLAHEVIMNAQDKLPVFLDFCKRNNFKPEEVAYMGDDLPDIPVLQHCGLAVCPSVRDLIEQVLRAQGKWTLDAAAYQTWRHAIESMYKINNT